MARKEKKYHFIYKTTNILSGKYYIGMHSTDNLEDGYLGSGRRLKYSINKYGVDNHIREILEFCDSRESLKQREKDVVNLNEIAKEECMNMCVGGEGRVFSIEESRKGAITTNNLRKELSKDDEWFNKLCDNIKLSLKRINFNHKTFEGKTHSKESKELISEKMKNKGIGKTNSQYNTCWVTKDGTNKKIKKEDLETYLKNGWVKGRK
jgi:hypothetical protein